MHRRQMLLRYEGSGNWDARNLLRVLRAAGRAVSIVLAIILADTSVGTSRRRHYLLINAEDWYELAAPRQVTLKTGCLVSLCFILVSKIWPSASDIYLLEQ